MARLYTGDPTALCPHDCEPRALNGMEFEKMMTGKGLNRIRHEKLGDGRSVCIYKHKSQCPFSDISEPFQDGNLDPDELVKKLAVLLVPTQG